MQDEHGDKLDGTEVLRLSGLERVNRFDDLADEYSIRVVPQADSGVIVYGLFRGQWKANPSLRPVVREMLRRMSLLQ